MRAAAGAEASVSACPQDPANAGDRAEQLEVATQCLSDAFEIDGNTAPELTLAEVYEAGMKALVRRTQLSTPPSLTISLPRKHRQLLLPCQPPSLLYVSVEW
jgi:hypothetical protein